MRKDRQLKRGEFFIEIDRTIDYAKSRRAKHEMMTAIVNRAGCYPFSTRQLRYFLERLAEVPCNQYELCGAVAEVLPRYHLEYMLWHWSLIPRRNVMPVWPPPNGVPSSLYSSIHDVYVARFLKPDTTG